MTGLTGQFYKQFAMTIAISTVISAFNSLTLSPALSAILLKGHHEKPDWLTLWHEPRLRPLLQLVQQHVRPRLESYGVGVSGVIRRKAGAMGVYALLVAATIGVSYLVPGGFVPAQDKQYLIGFTQLPNGASLDRTDAVIRRMSDIALKEPGVQSAIAFPGLSINGFTNSSSAGIVFVMLKPFNERKGRRAVGQRHRGLAEPEVRRHPGRVHRRVPAPARDGFGHAGRLQVPDRGPRRSRLRRAGQSQGRLPGARQAPELARPSPATRSTCRSWTWTWTASRPSSWACR